MATKKRPPTGRRSGAGPSGTRPPGGSARQAPRGSNRAARRRAATRGPSGLTRYGPWGAIGVVVLVVVVLVVVALNRHTQTAASGPAPKAVVDLMTRIPASAYDQAGVPVSTAELNSPIRLPAGQPALTKDGKPEIVYIGAEYCPFCAAERWGMVAALSRFGTFSHLGQTQSSSSDIYANTHTFSFYGSTYSSPYIVFTPVEIEGRSQGQPLQNPTAEQQALINKYDTPQFVPGMQSNQSGSIPFLDAANTFIVSGATSAALPQWLHGLSMAQIAREAVNPATDVGKAVLGTANFLSAAICEVTHGKPGSVCNSAGVKAAEAKLAK